MKIYTKRGDKGETSLFGGKRVSKGTLRVETYGTVDELNAVIGVCRSLTTGKEIPPILERVQHQLFVLGADLASPNILSASKLPRIDDTHVSYLEKCIDAADGVLPPLRNFILPSGTEAASMLHLARAVCRRAERFAVRLTKTEHVNPHSIIYLNRLSDLLFVLARRANALKKKSETRWRR